MKKIIKTILSLLALSPSSSVAFAAESKLIELESEVNVDDLRNDIMNSRKMLFKEGVMYTTIDEARRRFMDMTSSEDPELEFQETIELLESQGLISVDEKEIMSYGPSHY